MFDQVNLLAQWTSRIIKQTELRAHSESAFDQIIDQKLNQLVFTYHFNFEAIALHLILEFPHFQYKITKQSIAYRWYQLNLNNYSPSLTVAKNKDEEHKKCDKGCMQAEQQSSSEDSEQEYRSEKKKEKEKQKQKQSPSNRISELQKALQSALLESNSNHQQLILYKPNYHHSILPVHSLTQPLEESQLTKPTTSQNSTEDQIEAKVPKDQQTGEYQYGYNYSQLQQQFRHYNHMIQQYGLGFHEDSLTNSSMNRSVDQLMSDPELNCSEDEPKQNEQNDDQIVEEQLGEEHDKASNEPQKAPPLDEI